MKTAPNRVTTLRDRLGNASECSHRHLWGAAAHVSLGDLVRGTSLGGHLARLAGRSVLLTTRDPFTAALALLELDGVARRIVICTPDLSPRELPAVISKAGVDAIVCDQDPDDYAALGVPLRVVCNAAIVPSSWNQADERVTEWVLLTSGTTGTPRMLIHTLAGLSGAISSGANQAADIVWGTFYDIRRYGGLQILLRALLGRGSFVVSGAGESPGDYLSRLSAHNVTHLSGTPSHWRRALMSPRAHAIRPRYVRLSGEIADQTILNSLRSFYPDANLGHAYASTEAGVGFEVTDGLEGFPAGLLHVPGEVEMKIVDGSLRIRSNRTALSYLGEDGSALTDDEGFVDTGDMVEGRGNRYYFLGRRSGIINVGGLKVYPEEVEATINRHPAVRMSVVRAKRSPITGSLVVADVVLKREKDQTSDDIADVKSEILKMCQESLAAHKVPATIRFVPAVKVAAAGKLARHHHA